MNFLEMFQALENIQPNQEEISSNAYDPSYTPLPPSNWQEEFSGIKTNPVLYNMDGYISPYASNNWGGTSTILRTIADESRLPAVSDRVDPNRIFTSDISALRTQAADQMKITKMFEKRLMESLADRGKVGLNENDIMAMQALTSARASVTAIQKEQIAIKKNIADLRIKQQQQSGGSGTGPTSDGRAPSAIGMGRYMLDDIFNSQATSMPFDNSVNDGAYQTMTSDDVATVLDDIVDASANKHIQYEASSPKTYVVVGETDKENTFVTYDKNGNLLESYPNPESKIVSIDRNANSAMDDLHKSYEILTTDNVDNNS